MTVEPIASELTTSATWTGSRATCRRSRRRPAARSATSTFRDTAGQGMADFKRYFFPQVDKDALIIDERFNSGGQIADYYIDILRRPFASYWAPRHGADNRSPSAAVFGPKVMIIDEGAGSRRRHAAVDVPQVQGRARSSASGPGAGWSASRVRPS